MPLDFSLTGNLQLSLLVNDEHYSNFIDIHTYPFTDISTVSPNIIHGVHSKFAIELSTDKDHSVSLPDKMTIQIDDDFFEAFKMPYSLNGLRVTYQAIISVKFYAKEYKTAPIKFSFNQQDFYQTEQVMTYMP